MPLDQERLARLVAKPCGIALENRFRITPEVVPVEIEENITEPGQIS
jgi:hypothetical protein